MHSDVVCDVSYAGLAMRGDILGLERRRRWGDEQKLAIVLSVGVDGATMPKLDLLSVKLAHVDQMITWASLLRLPGALWPGPNL